MRNNKLFLNTFLSKKIVEAFFTLDFNKFYVILKERRMP